MVRRSRQGSRRNGREAARGRDQVGETRVQPQFAVVRGRRPRHDGVGTRDGGADGLVEARSAGQPRQNG